MLKNLALRIYHFAASEKRVAFYRKVDGFLRKIGGKAYVRTLGQLKYKFRVDSAGQVDLEDIHWDFERKEEGSRKEPLVSILVMKPENSLISENEWSRLQAVKAAYPKDSIEIQTCPWRKEMPLSSWLEKALGQAEGKLVWVVHPRNLDPKTVQADNQEGKEETEALQWISEGFLEEMLPLFEEASVMAAIADGAVTDTEGKVLQWPVKENELHWSENAFRQAIEIQNCTRCDLGGVLFRHPGGTDSKEKLKQIVQCNEISSTCSTLTDSVSEIINAASAKNKIIEVVGRNESDEERCITFCTEEVNCDSLLWILERIRGGSVEMKRTSGYIKKTSDSAACPAENRQKEISVIKDVQDRKQLETQDREKQEKQGKEEYEDPQAKEALRIVMVCYALKSGGGETYPIYLANELKQKGLTVTILNLDLEPEEHEIRELIDPAIPVVNLKHTDYLGKALKQLHADIVHSHHATADFFVASFLKQHPEWGKHIVTLHGMYETLPQEDCSRTIAATEESVSRYVYIADKNLDCFQKRNQYNPARFCKIANGLPEIPLHPVSREALGIEKEAFVAVLASRAIREKGWQEAVEAVKRANACSKRPIHLVLLGDGEEKERLEKQWTSSQTYIHLMGTVHNVRDYFAMGDVGLLPSFYKGESYPLVLIECLMAGKPVIASALGEIPKQIQDANGRKAGLLLPVKDWQVDPQDICDALLRLAQEPALYEELKANTVSVKDKFDLDKIAERYIALYKDVCKTA